MDILIFAIIVIVVVALLVWAVEKLPIPQPFNQVVQALIIVVAALVIAQRAAVF